MVYRLVVALSLNSYIVVLLYVCMCVCVHNNSRACFHTACACVFPGRGLGDKCVTGCWQSRLWRPLWSHKKQQRAVGCMRANHNCLRRAFPHPVTNDTDIHLQHNKHTHARARTFVHVSTLIHSTSFPLSIKTKTYSIYRTLAQKHTKVNPDSTWVSVDMSLRNT